MLLDTMQDVRGQGHRFHVLAHPVQHPQFAEVTRVEDLHRDIDAPETVLDGRLAHQPDGIAGLLERTELHPAPYDVLQRAHVAFRQVGTQMRMIIKYFFHPEEFLQAPFRIAGGPLAVALRVIADGGGTVAQGGVLPLDQRVLTDGLHHGPLLVRARVAPAPEHEIDPAVENMVLRQVAELGQHLPLLGHEVLQVA